MTVGAVVVVVAAVVRAGAGHRRGDGQAGQGDCGNHDQAPDTGDSASRAVAGEGFGLAADGRHPLLFGASAIGDQKTVRRSVKRPH